MLQGCFTRLGQIYNPFLKMSCPPPTPPPSGHTPSLPNSQALHPAFPSPLQALSLAQHDLFLAWEATAAVASTTPSRGLLLAHSSASLHQVTCQHLNDQVKLVKFVPLCGTLCTYIAVSLTQVQLGLMYTKYKHRLVGCFARLIDCIGYQSMYGLNGNNCLRTTFSQANHILMTTPTWKCSILLLNIQNI